MNSTFIIVPHANQTNVFFLAQIYRNSMFFAQGEGRQPHVEVVVGEIVAVDEFVDGAGVFAVAGEDVDVGGARGDVFDGDGVTLDVKNFDAGET